MLFIYSRDTVRVLVTELICRILHNVLDFQIKDLASITLKGCNDRSNFELQDDDKIMIGR